MLRLYSCVVEQHDLRFVVLAALICLFASFTTTNLIERARQPGSTRVLTWLSVAAVVFGSGVWTTHFVAELAYTPGIPVSYDIGLTAWSLAIALVVSYLGLAVTFRYRRWGVGGAIVGLAVGGMHYVGMAAMQAPADFHWHIGYVLASLAIGGTFAVAAMHLLSRGTTWRHRLGATLLLVVAISGLHFTAMTAVVLEFNPLIEVPEVGLNPSLLAASVTVVTVLIVALGLLGSIVDDHMARQAVREAERLRATELQLRQSMEHLARAQRISGVGSVERDLRTGRTIFSEEFYRILGVDAGSFEASFENVMRVVHPDDRAMAELAVREADRTGIAAPPLEFADYPPQRRGPGRLSRKRGDIRRGRLPG